MGLRPGPASVAYVPSPTNLRPTGAIAQTASRLGGFANTSTLTSGRLRVIGIDLPVGQLVSTASFLSATTALSGATHRWAALFSSDKVLRAVSADKTGAADWAANSFDLFTFGTPYAPSYSGLHYLGLVVVATTVPTLFCVAEGAGGVISGAAPTLSGSADTGLTDPASCPNPFGVIAATNNYPYAYVS